MEHSRDKAAREKRAQWLKVRNTQPHRVGRLLYNSARGPAIRLANGAYASLWDLAKKLKLTP
jgi:hypothetical protein